MSDSIQLFDPQGRRKYVTPKERESFLETAAMQDRQVRTFCSVLCYTGCRLSEALQVTPRRIDLDDQIIVFETLKQRRKRVYRATPIPASLADALDLVHGLREIQARAKKKELDQRLWPWSRTTSWRRVVAVMEQAGIPDGPHRCPKGLRHGYAIHALNKGIQLNLVSRWMGHSKMDTTAIYANAVGEEQQAIASRMW